MDYTVGSLADLISGKNTPNKPKVVKKEFVNFTTNTDDGLEEKNSDKITVNTNKRQRDCDDALAPSKKNKSILKQSNKKKESLKKKKDIKQESTSFTVIDHTQIDKLEKAIKEEKIDSVNEASENEENVNTKKKVDLKEVESRTIFVGNVAVTVNKTQLQRYFGKYGKIISIRLRCATPANPVVSKRVALIKKMLHPKRTTLHSYITFEKREDALKTLELNGKKYKEHYLRVQMCDDSTKPDSNKAIFIGNLPFDVEDDDLWKAFESCGSINSVRVVRNSSTGMGIGIGYVNFNSSDSVELALQMDDVTIKNKVVRIQRCHDKKTSRKQKYKKKNKSGKEKKNKSEKEKKTKSGKEDEDKQKMKKVNQEDGTQKQNPKLKKEKKNIFDKPSTINVKKSVFQGSKSNKKKQRPKVNKGVIQKLKLSQKIAPK